MNNLIEKLNKEFDFIEIPTIPVKLPGFEIHCRKWIFLIRDNYYPKVVAISEMHDGLNVTENYKLSLVKVPGKYPDDIDFNTEVSIFSVTEFEYGWVTEFIKNLIP